jgi:anti-anti-sigma factor
VAGALRHAPFRPNLGSDVLIDCSRVTPARAALAGAQFMLKPNVEVRDELGVLVAEFWDCLRLDPAPVQDLKVKLQDHLRRKGRPELVVDLKGVGFAGSAALGGFLTLHRTVKPLGGRVIFCNVDATVYEVFRVSKLDSFFAFVADVPAALALARSEPSEAPSGDRPPVADGQATRPASSSLPPLRRGRDRKA